MQIELTHDQSVALYRASEWYRGKGYRIRNPFVIAGYAGTGKTTMVRVLINSLSIGNVMFAAYTGKAADVLTQKGCPARTLHSIFYRCVDDIRMEFELKGCLDAPIDILVIDEFSMVPEAMLRDILSFGIPIIALGDTAQLPPVNGNSCMDYADAFLTEIQRQSEDSAIVQVATMARLGIFIPYGPHGEDVYVAQRGEIPTEELTKFDQVICRYNAQRRDLNLALRRLSGATSDLPDIGDKVICLKNTRKVFPDTLSPVVNGTIGYINEVKSVDERWVRFMFSVPTSDEVVPITADTDPFFTGDAIPTSFHQQFTYAYAITCHKAQGSEFDTVALFDSGKNAKYDDDDAYKKLLYTGITRARRKLLIIR